MAFIYIILLYIGISIVWQLAEKIIYRKVTPRILDDWVALILAISLYFNFT